MEKSREGSKHKSLRQQQVNPTADRNANFKTETSTELKEDLLERENNENVSCFDNYMKLNFYDSGMLLAGSEGTSAQFTELFCDFPVSYETTEVITTTQFAKHNLTTKPPPQPPPISQLPKRDTRLQQLMEHGNVSQNSNISLSAPATPSRGKVVLSKKERKELNKLHKLLDPSETTSNTSINLGHLEAAAGEILTGTHSENNTYRGRVLELKNCIAKINSKVFFGSLNRSVQKSLPPQEELMSTNEASLSLSHPPATTTDISPPTLNHNDASYSEKLKNLPVRQRKVHTSHMENYCLFDPVDFINDKALRKRTTLSAVQQVQQGLRDPLFSSRQSLEFPDEEPVQEIIYDNKEISDAAKERNFDHHNYFVIDPEDFEKELRAFDVGSGLPNKHTNEHFLNEKFELISNDMQDQGEGDKAEDLQMSKSFEHLLTQAHEGPVIVKSVSQESKDINVATALSGLVESSSSTASALTSSSTSATSTHQTTLQRTKKKLTFLSLSPFRSTTSHKNDNENRCRGEQEEIAEHERAVSELVSCDHMLHLQQMLNMRSRTVPIESNYVLFNPGPVPSRMNVPYKVRKPRPLSTNSDADSGFLSPCSPDEMSSLKSNPAILVLQQCDSVQGYLEIYTDWANYYLERAKSKKRVVDLSADCRDGLLLADVIEAVTSFKVPDLVKKPKNQQHMAVGGLDNVTTGDICAGRLKAVLALFFALSRYKQQAKQSTTNSSNNLTKAKSQDTNPAQTVNVTAKTTLQLSGTTTRTANANVIIPTTTTQNDDQCIQNGNEMMSRQIPTAYSKANGGTSIPLPATVMVQRRCPPDKVRPLPPTPNHTSSIPGLGKNGSEFNTSRPNSPPSSNDHSMLETKSGNNNGLRPPSAKSLGQSGIPPPSNVATTAPPQQKHSMLDKLKLFNKEKNHQSNSTASGNRNQTQSSKRTSSSSGFSSARSERSDSSLSLNDGHNISQIKPPAVSVSGNKAAKNNNTKQSKLMVAQMKKEQIKAIKLDKKERSPARSLNKEETGGNESRTSTLSRTKNTTSLMRTNEKHSTQTSGSKTFNNSQTNINAKTSSTKSLASPTGSTTGLPKPIAAIKGTSKLPQGPALLSGDSSKGRNNNESLKRESSDISSTQPNISERIINETIMTTPTHKAQTMKQAVTPMAETASSSSYYANASSISKPNSDIFEAANNNSSFNNSIISQEPTYINSSSRLPPPLKAGLSPHLRKLDYNTGSSNLISPQHSPLRNISQMTESRGSESVNQNSINNNNNNTNNNNSNNNNNNSNNINKNNPSGGKYYTVPSKLVGSTIYEDEKPVNVLPMRPLLRGYNSHVTLPTRGTRGGQGANHYVADFCENDIGQGYCSDGDVLRISNSRLTTNHINVVGNPSTSSTRFHMDIDNGYLSEGGGTSVRTGKHFLTVLRTRTQLPTTIEERIRNSRGSLDSLGTPPPSSAASQASSDNASCANSNMDATMNGGQQHHMSHRMSSRNINGRDNWSKMPEPLNGHKSDKLDKSSSPSHSRRHIGGSPSKQNSATGRTKGVPPSFGYVKRANGSAATAEQQNIIMMGGGGATGTQTGRTAHVSAVPRTATGNRKVSGGTQTLPNDMIKMPSSSQHRSFSLTGPGASQLSQSIRERLATGSHSLPKPGTDLHIFQHRLSNRTNKMLDGSLSDTQTYAEVRPEYGSTYAMWLKHSNTAGCRLSEGESLENLQIGSPNMTRHGLKLLHQHRVSNAVQQATASGCVTGESGESQYGQSPRLNRSNSISFFKERTYARSTKSEKMYPAVMGRGGGTEADIEPYYCLPVGTITSAAQNGTISAQMAAGAAAAVSHVSSGSGVGIQSSAAICAGGVATSAGGGSGMVAWSQPTSPSPGNRGFAGTLSPTTGSTGGGLTMVTGSHRLTYPKKNDEVHGSAASLLSGGSSLYGSAEERQANEIRRLKRELIDAREQVFSLSSQLSTNAHVVSAFEQSLSNMTSRLQQLTATAERKDGELTDMRQTIELLRKQSIQAGLTTAHMQSMGVQTQNQVAELGLSQKTPQHSASTIQPHGFGMNGNNNNNGLVVGGSMQRHHSSDSMCSLNSIGSNCSAQDKSKKKKGWLRSSFTKAFSRNAKISKTSRHIPGHHGSDQRMSGHLTPKHHHAATADQLSTNTATPNGGSPAKTVTLIENAKPIDAIDHDEQQMVEELKKQLREKDLVLTDIRLEALSSASQLENLKETVNKMRAEMMSLKQNNERLQKLVTSRSLAGSEVSLGNAISPNGSVNESRRFSLADSSGRAPMELPKRLDEEVEEENIPPAPAPEPPPPTLGSPTTHIDLTPPPPALETHSNAGHMPLTVEELNDVTDGKKIGIACYLGQPESFRKYCEEMLEADSLYANARSSCSNGAEADGNLLKNSYHSVNLNEFVIAYTYISGKTTWQNLDYIVRKTFKDYVARIDPGTNLGLNTDSITSYHLGEAKRGPEMGFPELLPCGYIIGSVRTLYICLQGVGSLAFDSLIPRSIVHRYISLLTEHRRLILCGPSGTGKSYLARRLAEFLVARSVRLNPSEAIATFNVDHKSSKDLRQYLGHIAEQAAIANGASELPAVIILDNLHHASALGDVFSCLLSAGPAGKLPCIIGTMSQATCNTTNLQLHHNFRWVLTANHMEPVKGFLGRFLRRRLFQMELQTLKSQPELASVLAWLPTVWQHINRFLEIHSSSDVTIGPRLFLTCPLDLKDSQIWFTDVWNYHLAPYLVEAVREGVQLYGRRGGPWNDPSIFIRNSYPWPYGPDSEAPLRQINAEDVGLEGVAGSSGENQDPLLNMLMRLQEAANYSENQDPESDCASLDSNITPDSSAGAE